MTKQFLLLSLLLLPFTSVGYEGLREELKKPIVKVLCVSVTSILTIALACKIVQYAYSKNKSIDDIMSEFTDIGKKSKQ